MTKETSINSPSSPTLHSSWESLPQNFHLPICRMEKTKKDTERIKEKQEYFSEAAVTADATRERRFPGGF